MTEFNPDDEETKSELLLLRYGGQKKNISNYGTDRSPRDRLMRERDIIQKAKDESATVPSTNSNLGSSFTSSASVLSRSNSSLSSSSEFGASQSRSFDRSDSSNNFSQTNNFYNSNFTGSFSNSLPPKNNVTSTYFNNTTNNSNNSATPTKRVQAVSNSEWSRTDFPWSKEVQQANSRIFGHKVYVPARMTERETKTSIGSDQIN